MWYSSMISKSINEKIKKNLQGLKNKKNYSISLGTIAIQASNSSAQQGP